MIRATEKLQACFEARIERGDKNPLLWAIYETFKRDVLVGGVCRLTADIFLVMAPFTLKYLIAYIDNAYHANKTNSPSPGSGIGLGYVIGITAMTVLQSLGTNHFIYRGMIAGGQIRGALIATIFQKSLKLSPRARAQGNTQGTADVPFKHKEKG